MAHVVDRKFGKLVIKTNDQGNTQVFTDDVQERFVISFQLTSQARRVPRLILETIAGEPDIQLERAEIVTIKRFLPTPDDTVERRMYEALKKLKRDSSAKMHPDIVHELNLVLADAELIYGTRDPAIAPLQPAPSNQLRRGDQRDEMTPPDGPQHD